MGREGKEGREGKGWGAGRDDEVPWRGELCQRRTFFWRADWDWVGLG